MRNRDSVVSVVIRLRTGLFGVHNWPGEYFTCSTTISRTALEPKQPPIQVGTGGFFVEGKAAGACI